MMWSMVVAGALQLKQVGAGPNECQTLIRLYSHFVRYLMDSTQQALHMTERLARGLTWHLAHSNRQPLAPMKPRSEYPGLLFARASSWLLLDRG